MRKFIILILFISLIISCSSSRKEPKINFNKIDISRSNGWNEFYSITTDSSGLFLLKKVNGADAPIYYKGLLPDSILRSITYLVDSINKTDYDTVYEPNCLDCAIYKIVISTKSNKFITSVRGNHSLKDLDSLVQIFTTISKKQNLEIVDTIYSFESFKYFLPPMLPNKEGLSDSILNVSKLD